jgi:DNA-binding LytR/AlgR family response regulator
MKSIDCIIVDDEPIARQIIATYIEHLPHLHVVASCQNAFEAREALQKQSIDLLFLDINMPVLDGLSFLKTIKYPPQVIFTTAYKEYAIDAFEIEAVDYLLKPFSLERFIKAINKVIEKVNAPVGEGPVTPSEGFCFIKADNKIYKVDYAEILYVEAYGNFTKVHLMNNILIPSMNFTTMQQLLPTSLFTKIHRSYIINKSHLIHVEGNRVRLNKTELPIGNNYRAAFLKELGL